MMRPAIPRSLPIKDLNWKELIPLMGRANRALADYNGMLRRLPNSSLLLTPLSVQEAVLSSRIEGTFATMTEVLEFEAGGIVEQESKRLDIDEILNYRRALDAAIQELGSRPFNLNLLLKLHKILLTSGRGKNKAPGEFRRQQNYVGSRVGGVEQIRFIPPEWTNLTESLNNWERYYHSDDLDPLIQMGIVHAQFEFLHPFLDGNGRLGRIIIPIFLFEKGLLSRPTFYLSEYIERNREAYLDHLNALERDKDGWNAWCRFFLNAVTAQAEENARKADAFLALYEDLKKRFLALTRSHYAVPLLDAIFQQPIFQGGQLQWAGDAPSKPTLAGMLQALHGEGILEIVRDSAGRRPSIWALRELISVAERKAE